MNVAKNMHMDIIGMKSGVLFMINIIDVENCIFTPLERIFIGYN